jgi:hypothetical protein
MSMNAIRATGGIEASSVMRCASAPVFRELQVLDVADQAHERQAGKTLAESRLAAEQVLGPMSRASPTGSRSSRSSTINGH